jgi:DNA-directed RNA polymerase sigma subunit (sigma70/sigma32)
MYKETVKEIIKDIDTNIFNEIFFSLNDREQYIFQHRRLIEKPITIKDLAEFFKLSPERIRQIESKAAAKFVSHYNKINKK